MTWAVREKGYSQRRACGLVGLHPKTYRYASTRPDDSALRTKLKELASQRRRFGYRRLGLLLARQGIRLNHKKLYRLYKEERLTVRKRGGRKRALGTRAPMAIPQDQNLRWSLDFVMDTLVSGRRFRILTLVDDFTRECLGLVADTSLTGLRVVRELDRIIEIRGLSTHDRQRQRHRVHLKRHPGLAAGARRRMALHRAGQTDAEWLCRELQRPTARRVPQRAPVQPTSTRRARSSKNGGSTTTPTDRTRASTGSHQLSSQHAPIRGKTGTDSPYERGQIGEQVIRLFIPMGFKACPLGNFCLRFAICNYHFLGCGFNRGLGKHSFCDCRKESSC